ncbi:GAF domain-containing protein [Halosegnis marinus]|uniref:GAF domain-containing protein n=1 Tax=Halosegnis marinus TaxID=3034023 RepID=UPI00361CD43C
MLTVYADRHDAFDGEERTVLAELADTVAKALTAAENRRRLEQYETVVDAVGDAVYACDAAGRIAFVNDAFEDLTGYDRGALVGSPLSRVFADGDLDRVESTLGDRDALSDGGVALELDAVRADGATVPCEVHVGVLSGASDFGGTAGVVRDVSDRRADERARRRLYELATDPDRGFEATCRGLLDLGCERLGVDNGKLNAVDAETGRHETVFAADGAGEGTTVAGDETYCRRVVDEERLVALHNAGEQGWADDPAYERYGHECYIGTEVVADGEPYGAVCFTDPSPRGTGFTEAERSFVELVARAVGHEIERERARDRLASREETLRRLHRVLSDPERDHEGKVEAVLELGREALGVRYGVLSQVNGDRYELSSLVAPDGYEEFEPGAVIDITESGCERTVADRETVSVASMADDPAWSDKPIHTHVGMSCYIGTPVVVEGDLHGTLCFHHDEPRDAPFRSWEETLVELLGQWVGYTLAERRNEAALARERDRLEEFAATLSHDLRTPLSVATGRLDLAATDAEDGAVAESLDAARAALDRMDALVDDTLALARQGRTVGETAPTDLGAAARTAWSHLDAADATLHVADDLPRVGADDDRLVRLLENVFANSLDHAGETVAVSVSPAETDGSGLGFRVDDDGPGIPESERETVFERGYSTSEDGTGFGLSIVERIATAHGWTVRAAESPDGGAAFVFAGLEAA